MTMYENQLNVGIGKGYKTAVGMLWVQTPFLYEKSDSL